MVTWDPKTDFVDISPLIHHWPTDCNSLVFFVNMTQKIRLKSSPNCFQNFNILKNSITLEENKVILCEGCFPIEKKIIKCFCNIQFIFFFSVGSSRQSFYSDHEVEGRGGVKIDDNFKVFQLRAQNSLFKLFTKKLKSYKFLMFFFGSYFVLFYKPAPPPATL